MVAPSSDSPTVSVRAPEFPKRRGALELTSKSFKAGDTLGMDLVFTGCGGKNVSPQLSWSGAPSETKSFVVTLFDPDAPTGTGYWHWLAFDIPAKVTSLDAGAGTSDSPAGGKTGYSDYGLNTYGGPCPPKGDHPHRYIFVVYALDVPSVKGAGKGTTGATLLFMIREHVLATGRLEGKFGH